MLKANPSTNRRLRDQRGVTLVESLVALSLLALGASAIGSFMTSQIRHASGSHLTEQAYALAAEEVERIRALPFSEMTGDSRTENDGDVSFEVASNVLSGVPSPNMNSVNVNVTWNAPGGRKSAELRTVYAQVASE